MSIGLVRAWKTELWAKAMDPWLPSFNETENEESLLVKRSKKAGAVGVTLLVKVIQGASLFFPSALDLICSAPILFCATLIFAYWLSLSSRSITVSSSLNQVVSFATRVNATYSASVDDRVTFARLLEHRLTVPPFSIKINPDVDFLVAWWPAQWESE